MIAVRSKSYRDRNQCPTPYHIIGRTYLQYRQLNLPPLSHTFNNINSQTSSPLALLFNKMKLLFHTYASALVAAMSLDYSSSMRYPMSVELHFVHIVSYPPPPCSLHPQIPAADASTSRMESGTIVYKSVSMSTALQKKK